jgi:hypothetical protein
MKQIISYDFSADNNCVVVYEILKTTGVRPLSITFRQTEHDNVTVEFNTTEDAIKFTEVYLDSDDPADIMEYVVDDALTNLEELRPA